MLTPAYKLIFNSRYSDTLLDVPRKGKDHYPVLGVAQKSTSFLYDYLRTHEDVGDFFADAPKKASVFYENSLKEGESVYNK